ncbi:hypothetical protein RRG08_022336 [Elysia crispata]|uniref:Acyl-CoA thioesterase 8 n=1 Tax=Elysia crispata TaxID=231223 RepID=A0AAE0Z100_9GAST|nr:hypothetical protein RRG08_022336 [Elysia crispata]
MHSYFLRPGSTARTILYQVDVTRAGKTYCTTAVKAIQDNNAIFTMQASFKCEEKNDPSYQNSMPKVPFPDELSSPAESLKKFLEQDLIDPERYKNQKQLFEEIQFLVKYVKEEQIVYRTSPRQTVWMKVKGHLPDDLHPNIHKCCLAYMTDMYLMSTASIPLKWVYGSEVFTTSLDHSMWFHEPARADQWMLLDVQIDKIGDGRTLAIGHVWDLEGTLIATITQEGVLRLAKPRPSLRFGFKDNASPHSYHPTSSPSKQQFSVFLRCSIYIQSQVNVVPTLTNLCDYLCKDKERVA